MWNRFHIVGSSAKRYAVRIDDVRECVASPIWARAVTEPPPTNIGVDRANFVHAEAMLAFHWVIRAAARVLRGDHSRE